MAAPAPELAGLGVAVEIDPALSSERVWTILERKVQRPQDYLPAEDVLARPNGDGGTYREMTVMGNRIIEDIYCTGAPLYEVLFKVSPSLPAPSWPLALRLPNVTFLFCLSLSLAGGWLSQ